MTVSSQVNRKDYAGNGSTTAFATEFRFLVDTDLKVILTVDSTSVETDQVLNTDYTVTGVGDDSGGTVTMIVPPATGETLTIKRDAPLTQNTDYVENDDFPAESHERALDKLTMNMQQQQEELDRSLKLSEGQQSSGLTIPAPETGKFLQWDALGNFINVDLLNQGLLIVTAFGQSLISAVDAAAGRLVMGSAKKISTAVTDNLTSFDSDDEAKDSGIAAADVTQSITDATTSIARKPLDTNNLLHIQDQKTSGTLGGTFTAGAWQTRDLNTEVTNNITGASLSTNQITLPAGTYHLDAVCVAKQCNSNIARLFDTDNTLTLSSGLANRGATSVGTSILALLSGSFTLGAETVVELQHQCETTKTTDGFGDAAGLHFTVVHEIYSDIKIWKVD